MTLPNVMPPFRTQIRATLRYPPNTTNSSRTLNAHLIVRRAAGSAFVLAGTFKVLLWGWHLLHPNTSDFAAALHQLGVPMPALFALLLPVVEILAGLCLLRDQWIRAVAAILAIDIVTAIALVGLPGWRGRALQIGAQSIGQEAWRLPLEMLLLVAMLWLIAKPRRQ
ncbi:MAG: putative oxidoreductase [Abditibacteriota bacterium]|nr:putative oxidoreductase [Abditibacteriota bacterium]